MKRWDPGIALIVALAASAGCSDRGERVMAPTPATRTTPEGAVRFFEQVYANRDTATYATLFTEDFQFYSDPMDSAGNSYRGTTKWGVEQELASARHLFVEGNAIAMPATSITLVDKGLFVSDTGDNLDQATHRLVGTSMTLSIVSPGSSLFSQGQQDFYLVRADAADLSPALRARVQPTDWLIYGWVERALSPPGGNVTWASIKRLYL